MGRKDRIPIVEHKPVRVIVGQALAELLERPFGGRSPSGDV
jgi:hypothetical protein